MGKNHLPMQGTWAPLLWSWRIPCATGQLSPGASTTAPVCLEPALAVRGRCSEKPAHRTQRSPRSPPQKHTPNAGARKGDFCAAAGSNRHPGGGPEPQDATLQDDMHATHCSPFSHHGRPCGQSLPCSSRAASSTTPQQPWSRKQLVTLQPLVPRQPCPVASLRKGHGLGACTSPRGMPPPQLPPVKTRTILQKPLQTTKACEILTTTLTQAYPCPDLST